MKLIKALGIPKIKALGLGNSVDINDYSNNPLQGNTQSKTIICKCKIQIGRASCRERV